MFDASAVHAAFIRHHNIRPRVHVPYSEDTARDLATIYGEARHSPGNPMVAISYANFTNMLQRQYLWLMASGLHVTAWSSSDDPYHYSADMLSDLARGHLYYLPTRNAGDLPDGHPMAERDAMTGLLMNDLFRIVHDVMGHGPLGASFGPRGEHTAWNTHARTFHGLALLALCCETRAQNAWFNVGPYAQLPPRERPFAEQKCAWLPRRFWDVPHVDVDRDCSAYAACPDNHTVRE